MAITRRDFAHVAARLQVNAIHHASILLCLALIATVPICFGQTKSSQPQLAGAKETVDWRNESESQCCQQESMENNRLLRKGREEEKNADRSEESYRLE